MSSSFSSLTYNLLFFFLMYAEYGMSLVMKISKMSVPTAVNPMHNKKVAKGPASWYTLASTNGPRARPLLPETDIRPIIKPYKQQNN